MNLPFFTMARRVLHRWMPPVPRQVQDDLLILRHQRLQAQIPTLYLALLAVIVVAAIGASSAADPFFRFGVPTIVALVCVGRILVWMRLRRRDATPAEATRAIRNMTVVSVALASLCSLWCIHSFLIAAPGQGAYFPFFMAMGSLSAIYCLSTIRSATIANLAFGVAPIVTVMLAVGTGTDRAMAVSLLVAVLFLVRMILQQHQQLVALLLLQRRMNELAHTDPLTGLANRRALDDAFARAIARTQTGAGDTGPAILLIDLDGFKPVNDRHGHGAGDALLCAVSDRLRRHAGDQAVVARLGGDEFAVLVPDIARADVAPLASRLLAGLAAPHHIAGATVVVGASLGHAAWPQDGISAAALTAAADAALYVAKHTRRTPSSAASSDEAARVSRTGMRW